MLPASQNGAVEEYSVLWTAQKHQKTKRWQDGLARLHLFNSRLLLYDSTRSLVASHYLVGTYASTPLLHDDEELELDNHLVQIQYYIKTENAGEGSGINQVREQRRHEIRERTATVDEREGSGAAGVRLPRMDLHSRAGTPRLGLTPAGRRRNPVYPGSAGAFTPVTPNVGRRLDYPTPAINQRSAPTRMQTMAPPKRTAEDAFGDGGFDTPARHKAPTPFRYQLDRPQGGLKTPLATPSWNGPTRGTTMQTPSRAPTRTAPVYPASTAAAPGRVGAPASEQREEFDIELEDLDKEFGEMEKLLDQTEKASPAKQAERPKFKPPRSVSRSVASPVQMNLETPSPPHAESSPERLESSCPKPSSPKQAAKPTPKAQQSKSIFPAHQGRQAPPKAPSIQRPKEAAPIPTTPIPAPVEPIRTLSTARKPTLRQPRKTKPAPLLPSEEQPVPAEREPQQQEAPPPAPIPQPLSPGRNLSKAPKPSLRQPRPAKAKQTEIPAQPVEKPPIKPSKSPSPPPQPPKSPTPHRQPSPHHETIHIPSQFTPPRLPPPRPPPPKPPTPQESFESTISQEMDRIFDLSSETEALLNTSIEDAPPQTSSARLPSPNKPQQQPDSRSPTPHPRDVVSDFPDALDGEDWEALADQLRAEIYSQEAGGIDIVDMSKVEDDPSQEKPQVVDMGKQYDPSQPEPSPDPVEEEPPCQPAPASRFQNRIPENEERAQVQLPPPVSTKRKPTLLSRKPPPPPPKAPTPPPPQEFHLEISSPPAPPAPPPPPAAPTRSPSPPVIHILATKRKRRTKAEIERDKQIKEEIRRELEKEKAAARLEKAAAKRKGKKQVEEDESDDEVLVGKKGKTMTKASVRKTRARPSVRRDEDEESAVDSDDAIMKMQRRLPREDEAPVKARGRARRAPKKTKVQEDEESAVDSDDAMLKRQRRLPREEPEEEPTKKTRGRTKTASKKAPTPPPLDVQEGRWSPDWPSTLEQGEDTPVREHEPLPQLPEEPPVETEKEAHQLQQPHSPAQTSKNTPLSRKAATSSTKNTPTITPRIRQFVSTFTHPSLPTPSISKPFRVPSLPLNGQINLNTPVRMRLEQARSVREGTVDEISSTLMQTQARREIMDGKRDSRDAEDGLGEEIEWSSDAEM
ncbi:hypothetical protein BJ508DRAFT_418532 [Ascobolus immersus RN42]|uniref:5'-3' DNA helicase ZGRF1-like N-terminal domain-containing protein n=1 Tax=Ascobolus immersus RN42 TaxID=1160509 RepID=A0A3N4HY23_ASCIM|nr:hypothetical protein BJ508DRAFT_418532 [Ascobolus immersus RN42]